MKTLVTLAGMAALATTAPAFAHRHHANVDFVQDDSNPYWLDYRTDVSEAKRELTSDLRHADDAGDRERAWSEYRREIADARADFRKEMIERGDRVGTVTVGEPD